MGKTKGNRKLRHRTEIVRDSIVDDYSSSTKNSNLSSFKNAVKNGRECSGSSGCNKSVPPSPPPSTALKSNTGSGVGKMRNAKKYKKNSTTLSSSDGLSMTCAYCNYECNRQPHMKKHLFRRHPEMFFEPGIVSSLSSWKTEHLKSILMEIVFPKFILTNEASTSCSCSGCGKIFGKEKLISHNRDALKMHLIDQHLQEVREQLKVIMEQSDASLQEQLDNIGKESTSSRESKLICKFCKKSFQQINNANRHMKYYCSKGEKLKPPNAGSRLTCTYCDYECANRRDHMNKHLIHRHPEMFFLSEAEEDNSSLSSWKQEHFEFIVKNIVIPKFILTTMEASSSSCSCSVCGKVYETKKYLAMNKSELRVHVFNNHIEEMRDHLKTTLGQSDTFLQEQLQLSGQNICDWDENDEMDDKILMDVDEKEGVCSP